MMGGTPPAAAARTVITARQLGAWSGLTTATTCATARHLPFRLQDAPHPRRVPDARGRCDRESQPRAARRQRARAGYARPHAPRASRMSRGSAREGGGQRLHLVREGEAAQRRRGSCACTRQASPWAPDPPARRAGRSSHSAAGSSSAPPSWRDPRGCARLPAEQARRAAREACSRPGGARSQRHPAARVGWGRRGGCA